MLHTIASTLTGATPVNLRPFDPWPTLGMNLTSKLTQSAVQHRHKAYLRIDDPLSLVLRANLHFNRARLQSTLYRWKQAISSICTNRRCHRQPLIEGTIHVIERCPRWTRPRNATRQEYANLPDIQNQNLKQQNYGFLQLILGKLRPLSLLPKESNSVEKRTKQTQSRRNRLFYRE